MRQYITCQIRLKRTLMLNEHVGVLSLASGGEEQTARWRLLFRELLCEWRYARPVRADWPRRREGDDESMKGSGETKLFETLNHLNQLLGKMIHWITAPQTPQTSSVFAGQNCAYYATKPQLSLRLYKPLVFMKVLSIKCIAQIIKCH